MERDFGKSRSPNLTVFAILRNVNTRLQFPRTNEPSGQLVNERSQTGTSNILKFLKHCFDPKELTVTSLLLGWCLQGAEQAR